MKEVTRQYSDDLPYTEYVHNPGQLSSQAILHWGQRKLLLSEIDFMARYYEKYDPNEEKIVLYIGASPGFHINYMKKMFPEIKFILYDLVPTKVELDDKAIFNKKYFTDEEASKYKDQNIFIICDIRDLDIRHISFRPSKNEEIQMDKLILEDMEKQKRWCEIIKPKSALLKFRVSWNTKMTKYFDGDLYFQIWAGNSSTEMRLVPDINKTKMWDNKKIEGIIYHYNMFTRRKQLKDKCCLCIGSYHESFAEADILQRYIKKFTKNIDNIDKKVCELSISITIFLMGYSKNRISEDFLKRVPTELAK